MGIAETIRQGLFAEEFDKLNELKARRGERDSALALDESRRQEDITHRSVREAVADEQQEARVTRQVEQDRLRGEDRTANRAHQATIVAGQQAAARSAVEANVSRQSFQDESLKLRGEANRSADEDRDSSRSNRLIIEQGKLLQKNIDDLKGDADAQDRARQELNDFMAGPEEWLARQGESVGAPPEAEQGALSKIAEFGFNNATVTGLGRGAAHSFARAADAIGGDGNISKRLEGIIGR